MPFKGRVALVFMKVYFFLVLWSFVRLATANSDIGFSFVEWPSWEVVAPGQELVLRCATNLPPDDIQWYHNHRPIYYSKERPSGEFDLLTHINVTSSTDKGNRLVLKIGQNKNVFKQQEGLYQCVARVGSISVTSLPGRVEVAFISDFDSTGGQQLSSSLRVLEGEPFRVSCSRPKSIPEAKIHYYKNGLLLDVSKNEEYYETQSGDLIALEASASSKGVYSCSAYNEILKKTVNLGQSTAVHIEAKAQEQSTTSPPFILSFQPVYSVVQGEKVHMLCLAFGNPRPHLWWSVHETPSKPSYVLSEDTTSLVISRASPKDEGLYRCHANNTQGQTSLDIALSVQEPPYLVEGAESKTVSEGDSATLKCVFHGSPIPTIAWVFNGNLLTSDTNVRFSGNHLDIVNTSRRQAGVYQCFAFNSLGAAEGTALLTIIPKTITAVKQSKEGIIFDPDPTKEKKKDSHGFKKNRHKNTKNKFTKNEKGSIKNSKTNFNLPSRPSITKLTDHSVMVNWNVSEVQEAPQIIFFKVQYRVLSDAVDHSNKRWKTIDDDIFPHVRSFEIMGLKSDRLYRFRVGAVYHNNESEMGPSSKRFFLKKDIQLKPPKGFPMVVNVTSVDNHSVCIWWDYTSSSLTEGFIIYYRDSTSAADYTKMVLLGDYRRNYTIPHLSPNNSYDFKICSFNMAGSSVFSPRYTYLPHGMNLSFLTNEEEERENAAVTLAPIVRTEPQSIKNHHLYIALGVGLSVLLVIVAASFIVYKFKKDPRRFPLYRGRTKKKEVPSLPPEENPLQNPPPGLSSCANHPKRDCDDDLQDGCPFIESHQPIQRETDFVLTDNKSHSLPLHRKDVSISVVPMQSLAKYNNNNSDSKKALEQKIDETNAEMDIR